MFKTSLLALFIFFASTAQLKAVETCSRVAIINFQEILVDTNSTEKGEGLRYYLDKDPQAKMYLEKYQEGTQIKWQNALLGTAGSTMLIGGLLTSDSDKKQTFLISGATLIALNFLVARTLEMVNEDNLNKAIEEYNKRNLPKIYFSPEGNKQSSSSNRFRLMLAKNWSF